MQEYINQKNGNLAKIDELMLTPEEQQIFVKLGQYKKDEQDIELDSIPELFDRVKKLAFDTIKLETIVNYLETKQLDFTYEPKDKIDKLADDQHEEKESINILNKMLEKQRLGLLTEDEKRAGITKYIQMQNEKLLLPQAKVESQSHYQLSLRVPKPSYATGKAKTFLKKRVDGARNIIRAWKEGMNYLGGKESLYLKSLQEKNEKE